MWESISNVLTSGNALLVITGILILMILIAVLAKAGIFQLSIRGIRIGGAEDERAIIRRQTEWVELQIQAMSKLPIFQQYDNYHTLYILEKAYDEVIKWIVFNHISDCADYITIKQEKIWNLVQTLVTDPKFSTDEFKDILYEHTDKLIRRLVYIRKHYHK